VVRTPYKPTPVRATLIEKRGICPYEVGHTIVYGNPVDNPRPTGECWGITHPLAPIVMACALGFKSWEKADPDRYYISCLSKRGTVWRVERVDDEPLIKTGRGAARKLATGGGRAGGRARPRS